MVWWRLIKIGGYLGSLSVGPVYSAHPPIFNRYYTVGYGKCILPPPIYGEFLLFVQPPKSHATPPSSAPHPCHINTKVPYERCKPHVIAVPRGIRHTGGNA
jgi:hypothetical protein